MSLNVMVSQIMYIKAFQSQLIVSLFVFLFTHSAVAGLTLRMKNGQNIDLYTKSYALVIGVSNYDKWQDLPGVKEDISLVKASLEKHGFNVITVKDPTRVEFDTSVRNFIADYGQEADNRLLFYFAGHGHTLKTRLGRKLGYIVPSDAPRATEKTGAFKRKAISMREIEIYARQMESKHALFVFDSCFSGALFALTRSMPQVISTKLALPVRQFITSGSADQEVPDASLFRRQFVSALDGAADMNNDGYITGSEIAYFLEDKVTNYSNATQTPQYGKIRDPILDKGDIVFQKPGFDPSTVVVDEKAVIAAELAEKHALISQLKAEQERLAVLQTKSGLKKLSGPNNRVLIATHGQINPEEDITDEEHGLLISTLLKKLTHQFVTVGTNIKELKDHSEANGLLFESDSGDKSKLLCQKHKSDHIIAGLLDEDFSDNPAMRDPPRMSYFVYDCQKNIKTKFKFYPAEQMSDKFVHEKSISKEYRRFIRSYIQGDSG